LAERLLREYAITFPLHLSNASALTGKTQKCKNRIFSLQCCITALPEFNQSLLNFFSIADFAARAQYSCCCITP